MDLCWSCHNLASISMYYRLVVDHMRLLSKATYSELKHDLEEQEGVGHFGHGC